MVDYTSLHIIEFERQCLLLIDEHKQIPGSFLQTWRQLVVNAWWAELEFFGKIAKQSHQVDFPHNSLHYLCCYLS